MTHPTKNMQRIEALTRTIRALRVLHWSVQWPHGHPERPQPPDYVVEFEARNGPAPASAERVLA